MLQRLAYRYHRFLGIMFITIIGSGLIKMDFSKPQSNQSNSSKKQKIDPNHDLATITAAKFIPSSYNLQQQFCCAFVAGKLFNHEY